VTNFEGAGSDERANMAAVNAERHDRVDESIAAQARYYDLRAPDYLNCLAPPDRQARGVLGLDDARSLVDELAPEGDVLELACGPGAFTAELAHHAVSVTAIDASENMLARNRAEVDRSNVRYVHADLFNWWPDRAYDLVFFGFWLSHVPLSRFDDFWRTVGTCVRDRGRVAFVDENDRASVNDDVRGIDGVPLARRTLRDGREFDVVKIFWDPEVLTTLLETLGWAFDVRRVRDMFMLGVGRPKAAT